MSCNFLQVVQVAQGRELWFITSSHSMAVMYKVGYNYCVLRYHNIIMQGLSSSRTNFRRAEL